VDLKDLLRYKAVLLYLLFGGLTTIINLLVYIASRKFGHLSYEISTTIAWFLSVLFAYLTNKYYVFEAGGTKGVRLSREILAFFVYRVASLVMELMILFILFSWLQLPEFAVKLFAQFVVIVANYLASKYLIFTERNV
jgi:putative flippase GtrA